MTYSDFSSNQINENQVYLNSINWRKGRDEEEEIDDFSEDDTEYPNSYRTENSINWHCSNSPVAYISPQKSDFDGSEVQSLQMDEKCLK